MESILQYIYLRQVDITCHNATDIMRTADYLGIEGLVQLCHEFLTEILTPDNCVSIMQFAEYVFNHIQNFKIVNLYLFYHNLRKVIFTSDR